MPKVLVTPVMLQRQPGPYLDILQAGGFEVAYPPEGVDTLTPEVIGELLPGVDAILASTEPLTGELLSRCERLRVIARMGVGYDSVDIPAADRLGVAVTTTPGTLEDSVAEHTMALLLAVTRGVITRDREVRQGNWTRSAMPRLTGKTFGIIGLGRIGKAVAARAQGMMMKVIAFDPYANEQYAQESGVKYCSLEDLLTTADVISLHAASTPSTADLINAERLAMMKPTAILINTSRGGLVDEEALIAALREQRLFGAGLDVFKQEPLPLDSPLLEFNNVALCTHTGGIDDQSQIAASSLAAQCIVDLHQGQIPKQCIVNENWPADWRW